MDTVRSLERPERMCSVLPPYSACAPLYGEKFEPARLTSGFVSSPHNLAGRNCVDPATADYKASFRFAKLSPNSSPTSVMQKFEFDSTAALPHIPVCSRKVLFGKM